MKNLEILFCALLGITFYAYISYGILIWMVVKIKGVLPKNPSLIINFYPK